MTVIADIRLTPLVFEMPKERARFDARGGGHRRAMTLVELTTDDGVTGIGEAFGGPGGAAVAFFEAVREQFIGADPLAFPHIAARVLGANYHMRAQGQMGACLSGIGTAALDAAGKALGVPAYRLLGGAVVDRVPVYASGGFFSDDPRGSFRQQLELAAAHPYPGHKIKCGANPRDDVARVRLAREIIGDDPLLMIDFNGNYTYDTALESMNRVADFDIHWVEEPVALDDWNGFARLAGRSPLRIATGEALAGISEFRQVMATGAVDVVTPDLNLCGGPWEARMIAALAAAEGIRVSPHVFGGAIGLAVAVHFAASLPAAPHVRNFPYPTLVEYDYWENGLRTELLTEPLVPEDGHIAVPQGPGLGIELNRESVRRFAA